ncbi:MAG: hypothetical protein PHX20_02405 [Candidatus Omnitrophica bacterium]|nr:hypothetical protein [Candidatus Omnitrophota bacterium]MDD5436373.1 hypothetical protein [Candidatus Omnitrophota bacterium]
MCPGEFIFWMIFILAVVTVTGVVIHHYRTGNNFLKETASSLGAKGDSTGKYVINKNGVKYWYQYSPGGKNTPPSLNVGAQCLSHGEFTVVHESEFDRTAKRIGFSTELQTGDEDFDSAYYILSDTVDFARVYFQSAEKREVIKNIYRAGFCHIAHNGKSIEVTWTGFDKSSLSPALITGTIEKLDKLSRNIPDYFPDQEVLGIPRPRIKVIGLYLFPSLVAAAAIAAWFRGIGYPPLDGSALFMRSLSFSIPALVFYLAVTALAIRGRAAAHKDFLKIALVSAIAFILIANNVFVLVNGSKDTGEPMSHTVAVVGKYLTHHKNSTTCHVLVRSWRPGHDTEGFTVGDDTYSRIQPNRTEAIIITKPGAAGFEWVLSKQFRI